jgi:hypothetical protein
VCGVVVGHAIKLPKENLHAELFLASVSPPMSPLPAYGGLHTKACFPARDQAPPVRG